MRSCAATGLLLATCVLAQEPAYDPRPALNWVPGVTERFSKFTNPVVSAYSLARLARIVCVEDKGAGGVLFTQAFKRIDDIKTEIFFDPKIPLLPVASFTKLWKTVSADAIACDPNLAVHIDLKTHDPVQQRLLNERTAASNNNVISEAIGAIEPAPDRAAQLADLVLEAGDPNLIDFDSLGLFAAMLRERSPELADDVFRHALETVVSEPARSTANLSFLGKYLFIFPEPRPRPDAENRSSYSSSGPARFYNFTVLRRSANSDLVADYVAGLVQMIDAALKPVANDLRANAQFYGPTAIHLATSLLPHARFLELDKLGDLQAAIPKLEAALNGQNLQVPQPPARYDNPAYREASLYARTRALVTLIKKAQYTDARRELNGLGDSATTRQLGILIDFQEGSEGLKSGDFATAARLANRVQPGGVARSLLYTALLAQPSADEFTGMALTDIEALPAEFRGALSSSVANALISRDPNRALSLLTTAVAAQNSALSSPRTWRFDPRRQRCPATCPAGRPGAGTAFDIVNVLMLKKGFTYVVDTGDGRINFPLDVSNTGPFRLYDVIRRAKTIEPKALEVVVLDLRDEAQRAEALLAIADLRFERPVAPAATEIP